MKMLNRVKSVRWLGDYRLKLVFKDGYVGEVDLHGIAESPRGPMEQPLKEIDFFKEAVADGYSVAWPNGYDISPDTLRHWCEIGRACSQEELDAAFAKHSETSAFILHDKPSEK
ncbi:MAG: DUF2442 domain-containing protein [Verrucomicrobia bacterium]|nr:DUF2442 domain-containing protein [Verrucomicrobiota bacterium]